MSNSQESSRQVLLCDTGNIQFILSGMAALVAAMAYICKHGLDLKITITLTVALCAVMLWFLRVGTPYVQYDEANDELWFLKSGKTYSKMPRRTVTHYTVSKVDGSVYVYAGEQEVAYLASNRLTAYGEMKACMREFENLGIHKR